MKPVSRREILKLLAITPLAIHAGKTLMKTPEVVAPAPAAPVAVGDGKLRCVTYGKHSSITFESAEDDEMMRNIMSKLATNAAKTLDEQAWGGRLMG